MGFSEFRNLSPPSFPCQGCCPFSFLFFCFFFLSSYPVVWGFLIAFLGVRGLLLVFSRCSVRTVAFVEVFFFFFFRGVFIDISSSHHISPVRSNLKKSLKFQKINPLSTIRCKTMTNRKYNIWASLVAQWLRICLLMQGTGVRALVWEDPTCRGATRPMSHNY